MCVLACLCVCVCVSLSLAHFLTLSPPLSPALPPPPLLSLLVYCPLLTIVVTAKALLDCFYFFPFCFLSFLSMDFDMTSVFLCFHFIVIQSGTMHEFIPEVGGAGMCRGVGGGGGGGGGGRYNGLCYFMKMKFLKGLVASVLLLIYIDVVLKNWWCHPSGKHKREVSVQRSEPASSLVFATGRGKMQRFCCCFCCLFFKLFYYIIFICISIQRQYNTVYEIQFLWTFTINMQDEERLKKRKSF